MIIPLLNRFWKRGKSGTEGQTSTVFHTRFARPPASGQLAATHHGVLKLEWNKRKHNQGFRNLQFMGPRNSIRLCLVSTTSVNNADIDVDPQDRADLRRRVEMAEIDGVV